MIRLAQTPRQFAPSPTRSLLHTFYATGRISTLHRPIPAPEPNPEPNPGPDSIQSIPSSSISAADWDTLFHAITLRLENCVSDALIELPHTRSGGAPELLQARHQATKTAVLECVDAMKRLHAELQIERQTNSGDPATRQAQPPQQH
jgi:hypothetical protein